MGAQNDNTNLWFQQAFAAHSKGMLAEAEALYRKVLKKNPSHPESIFLLGTALGQLNKSEEAEKYLREALEINPANPEALNNLGLTLRSQGKTKEAVQCFRQALALQPDYADAHSNLGGALEALNELDEAEHHLRRALQIDPNLADAHYQLGIILRRRDKFEDAARSFLRGLELKPDFASAYCDLGAIYKMWGRNEEALACNQRALALQPDFYSAQLNLGAVYEEMGRLDEATAAYQRAIELNPADTAARWNMAYLYLKQGILDKGWEAHEMRFQLGTTFKRFPFPDWDGSSLQGKRILIYAEQGLGDEILFASCFPDVIAQAGHCVIECTPRLAPIFARSFPGATVRGENRFEIGWVTEIPPVDFQIVAGSLPRFLRPTLESFPQTPSYLVADEERARYWRDRLSALGDGFKVGICWRSGLVKGERFRQYSELTQWGEIFAVPGVQFVNLQYGECSEELREAEEKFGIKIHVFPELDLKNEIDESAALISGLDLVISAATATCEIAAALGVNTHRLDAFGKLPDHFGTDRMLWHPTLKSFGQPVAGDWNTPLALVAQALKEKISGRESTIRYLRLPSGAEIAVENSLEDLAAYVLDEQGGWFDQEYEFVLGLAEAGMTTVELGAGVGAYAIPMARAGTKVLALAANAADLEHLHQSRKRNGLDKSITTAITGTSLDEEMDRYGLDNVAFVKLATDFATPEVLRKSNRFFAQNSPLVMFGIRVNEDIAVARQFLASGFALYKFAPGPGLLVPYSSPAELDALSLNLFACKEEMALMLERRDKLLREIQAVEHFPGIEEHLWQDYLRQKPYAAKLVDDWLSAPKQKDWEVYWMALNLYARSKSASPAGDRYSCLQTAATVMHTLIRESATIPRLLSLARMLIDLGMREAAVNLLNHVCTHFNPDSPLAEPFIALSEEFEKTETRERMPKWLVAMILESREKLRAFSSYFTGQESLSTLKEIRNTGFMSPDMERRIDLIEKRFGLP